MHEGGGGKARAPLPTVDIIIELEGKGVVLIKRKNPPFGWALPGGFVDYGVPRSRSQSLRQQKLPIPLPEWGNQRWNLLLQF
jgi:hypothetical protein